jgi:hypothetical protein
LSCKLRARVPRVIQGDSSTHFPFQPFRFSSRRYPLTLTLTSIHCLDLVRLRLYSLLYIGTNS